MFKHLLFVLTLLPLCSHAVSDQKFFELKRMERLINAPTVKSAVTQFNATKQLPKQTNNGDEQRYNDLRGSFGKALEHKNSGYINPNAFNSLVFALYSGESSYFDNIIMGIGDTKLVNPQGSLAYSLAANDGWINAMPPAPAFASAEAAAEMVELYWTVLARDISFNQFLGNPIVTAAITELSSLTDFTGPKENGQVTAGTFLRGNTPGDLTGPYVSQFLYKPVTFGVYTIVQEQLAPMGGSINDFNTTFNDWFTVVNGGVTGESTTPGTTIFIRNPRDLANYVHFDPPGQAFVNALWMLASWGDAALDPSNPYLNNPTQNGFASYGIPQVYEMLIEAAEEGLKAAWYQKWQVNRRLRPEEFGFYVQQQKNGTPLGINAQLINSQALADNFAEFNSYFLAQAYPEGSPTHPSYPAGHAVLSGAAATILKAFFNEDFNIPSPVQPDNNNLALENYMGTLKVGDELNKLAANISLGRDHAGVHYRSDGAQGMNLGEKIAIDILNNASFLQNENFSGFTLTKFNGQKIIVGAKRTP